MCWNARVSLSTFLFSIVPLVICYLLNLVTFRAFLFYQSFMMIQFVEYLLWTFLNNKTWNKVFSIFGFIAIFLLAFFSIYSVNNKYTNFVLGLYILFYLYILTCIPIKFYTSIASNKHLSWEWLQLPLPIIFVWTLFFMYSSVYAIYTGIVQNIMIILFVAFVYIFSFYSYYSSKTFGSMWCWISNALSVYFYYLLIKYLL